MYLEKESQILKQIGPFERAKTNLDKFVWNFMILYTTYALTEIWKSLETVSYSMVALQKTQTSHIWQRTAQHLAIKCYVFIEIH